MGRRKRKGISPIKVGSFLFKNAKIRFGQRRSKREAQAAPLPRRPSKPWLEAPDVPYPGTHTGAAKSPGDSILWMRARLRGMRQRTSEDSLAIRAALEDLAPFWKLVEDGPPPYDLGDQEFELVKAAADYLSRTNDDTAAQLHAVPFLDVVSQKNPELRQAIFASAPHLETDL